MSSSDSAKVVARYRDRVIRDLHGSSCYGALLAYLGTGRSLGVGRKVHSIDAQRNDGGTGVHGSGIVQYVRCVTQVDENEKSGHPTPDRVWECVQFVQTMLGQVVSQA